MWWSVGRNSAADWAVPSIIVSRLLSNDLQAHLAPQVFRRLGDSTLVNNLFRRVFRAPGSAAHVVHSCTDVPALTCLLVRWLQSELHSPLPLALLDDGPAELGPEAAADLLAAIRPTAKQQAVRAVLGLLGQVDVAIGETVTLLTPPLHRYCPTY